MELFWWLLTLFLMAIGVIGTVVPVLPGTAIIFGAALIHRFVLGPEKSLGWLSLLALALLVILSYLLDFFGSWLGAKKFGATRWGTFGAIVGAIVGLFFGLPGLLAGPIVGALLGEIISGKKLLAAGRAGWGAFLGNLAGMLAKLLIGFAMVSWFLLATPTPF